MSNWNRAVVFQADFSSKQWYYKKTEIKSYGKEKMQLVLITITLL